jgi:hypothetical protein
LNPQKGQLKTRRIAKARIHVERVIERVKKFKLLSGNIPLSLSPLMDQLVFVAWGLFCLKIHSFQLLPYHLLNPQKGQKHRQ